MGVLGEAFVAVSPLLDNFADKLRDGVRDSLPDGEAEGSTLGSKLSTGLKVGLAAGAAGVATGFAVGFSQALDRAGLEAQLQNSMGLDPETTDRLGKAAAQSFTSGFGGSLEEAFQGLEVVASQFGAALPTDQLAELNSTAITLASTFGEDMSAAVTAAGQALNAGLATDAEHAMDLTVAALQRVPQALRGEVIDAIHEYSPMLAQLGLTGEEAFGLLAKAAEQGQYGIDKTGDALKEFTIRATDMSTTSVEAFKAMGLNADEMASRILAGGEDARSAFDSIIDALLAMEDPVLQANTAIALFGTPIEDLATGEIPKFLEGLDSMSASLGDVSNASEELKKNAASPMQALENLRRKGMIALGEAVAWTLPYVQSLSEWIGVQVPRAFRALQPYVDEVIGGVRAMIAAFRDGSDDITSSGFAGAMERIGVVARNVYDVALPPLRQALAFLAEGARFVADHWQVFAGVLVGALSPIGAVGAALVVAYQRIDGFREIVDRVAAVIRDVLPEAFDFLRSASEAFVSWWQENWRGVLDGVVTAFDGAATVVRGVIDVIVSVVSTGVGIVLDLWNRWGDRLVTIVREAWDLVWRTIENAVTVIRETVELFINIFQGDWGEAFGNLRAIVAAAFDQVVNVIVNAGPLLLNAAQLAVNGLWVAFQVAWDALLEGAYAAVNAVVGVFENLLDRIPFVGDELSNILGNTFGGLKKVLDGVLDTIRGFVNVVRGLLTGDFSRVWDGLKSIVTGAFQAISAVITTALKNLGQVFEAGLSVLRAAWDAAWAALTRGLPALLGKIVDVVKELPGMLLDAIVAGGSALLQIGYKLIDYMLLGLDEAVSIVLGWFSGLPGLIVDALGAAGGALLDAGQAAMGAMLDGITAAADGVLSFFAELPGRIVDALGDLGGVLLDAMQTAGGLVLDGIGSVIDGWIAIFTEFPGRAVDAIGDLGATIWNAITGGLATALENIAQWAADVVQFYLDLPGRAVEAIGDLGGTIWNAISSGLSGVISNVSGWVGDIVRLASGLPGKVVDAIGNLGITIWNSISSGLSQVWVNLVGITGDWVQLFREIPGRIVEAVRGFGERVWAVIKEGWNLLARNWNSLIGGKGFSIPDIPGLPGRGKRLEVPRLPELHTGGIVPGAPGSEQVYRLLAGEGVFTREQMEALARLIAGGGVSASGGGVLAPVYVSVDARGNAEPERVAALTGSSVARVFTSRHLAIDARGSR